MKNYTKTALQFNISIEKIFQSAIIEKYNKYIGDVQYGKEKY